MHFNVVRFDLVTEATVQAVSLKFIDSTKNAARPSLIVSIYVSLIQVFHPFYFCPLCSIKFSGYTRLNAIICMLTCL